MNFEPPQLIVIIKCYNIHLFRY